MCSGDVVQRRGRALSGAEIGRLRAFLRKRPRTSAELLNEFHRPVLDAMKELSDRGEVVMRARAWSERGGWRWVWWIEPERRSAAWRRSAGRLRADFDNGEVV